MKGHAQGTKTSDNSNVIEREDEMIVDVEDGNTVLELKSKSDKFEKDNFGLNEPIESLKRVVSNMNNHIKSQQN